jgi:hypothetical protein
MTSKKNEMEDNLKKNENGRQPKNIIAANGTCFIMIEKAKVNICSCLGVSLFIVFTEN